MHRILKSDLKMSKASARRVPRLLSEDNGGHYPASYNCKLADVVNILSTKRNAMFLFAILGVKIIDFKNCFNSVVLPSNKDLDCIVSS